PGCGDPRHRGDAQTRRIRKDRGTRPIERRRDGVRDGRGIGECLDANPTVTTSSTAHVAAEARPATCDVDRASGAGNRGGYEPNGSAAAPAAPRDFTGAGAPAEREAGAGARRQKMSGERECAG